MKTLFKSILKTTTQPGLWEEVLDEFNSTFGVGASCMFTKHEFRNDRANFAWSKFNRDNLPPNERKMMELGQDYDDLPGFHMLARSPAQKFYDDTAMFSVDSKEELPTSKVRDLTKSLGIIDRTAAMLNKHGPWMDAFLVQGTHAGETKRFLADERVDMVLPVMASSVSLGRTLLALRARYQAALSVLDNLGLGVFLVDQTGCIIERNKEAQRILDLKDGLSMSRGMRLALSTPDETAQINAMIDAANRLLNGEVKNRPDLMSAHRPSGEFPFVISTHAVSDGNDELETGLNCTFVNVIDPMRHDVLSAEGLAEVGNLSKAEASTVGLLVQGYKLNEVSARRDVSMNTIKTQMKSISQKLRCKTQADIIRAAAATRIPLV